MFREVVITAICVGSAAGLTMPALGRRHATLIGMSVAAEPDPTAAEELMPLVGAPFEVEDYPLSGEEMVQTYVRWCASRGETMTVEEARGDVQCFMEDEALAEKWRPILQEAAKERNKLTPAEVINAITSFALPIAVGFTILPLLRDIGERVPFVNDVIIPQIDGAVNLAKTGVKKAVELPICLEFGDC